MQNGSSSSTLPRAVIPARSTGIVPPSARFRRVRQPVAHARCVGGERQMRGQIVFVEDRRGAAIVEHVRGFGPALADVAGHADRADPRAGDEQHHVVRPVAEQDHHPFARLDAQLEQAGGAAVRPFGHVAVSQAQVPIHQRDFTPRRATASSNIAATLAGRSVWASTTRP